MAIGTKARADEDGRERTAADELRKAVDKPKHATGSGPKE